MIKTDSDGIIGQPDRPSYPDEIEGGDSVNWMGHLQVLGHNEAWPIQRYISTFESPFYKGNWVRHPRPTASAHGFASWIESNWVGVISVDQLSGILCALVLSEEPEAKAALVRTYNAHKMGSSLFLASNVIKNGVDPATAQRKKGDPTLFKIWGLYIRGLGNGWIDYIKLNACDLELLGSAIINRFSSKNDVISHCLRCITAAERWPTPVSWLTNRVNNADDMMRKLEDYWCGWRNQCDMASLYEPKIKKYFKGL